MEQREGYRVVAILPTETIDDMRQFADRVATPVLLEVLEARLEENYGGRGAREIRRIREAMGFVAAGRNGEARG